MALTLAYGDMRMLIMTLKMSNLSKKEYDP